MNRLNEEQIEDLEKSGKILHQALCDVAAAVKPGVSTAYLDEVAEKSIRSHNAVPAFKDYYVEGIGTFPSSLCVSVNDEIVHGIPSKDRILQEGDIVSLDLGAGYNGIYTDSAITVPVGKISQEAEKLLKVTEQSLYVGIDQAVIGAHIGDIGHAIQSFIEPYGYGIVRNLVGHGIGTEPHTDPQVPNYGYHGEGPILHENEAICIEPMINLGTHRTKFHRDGWTISTADGSLSAHFEHTILITKNGPLIITR